MLIRGYPLWTSTHEPETARFTTAGGVALGRGDDGPDPDILDIEAEGPSIAVSFGYVDVDYGDEPDF